MQPMEKKSWSFNVMKKWDDVIFLGDEFLKNEIGQDY